MSEIHHIAALWSTTHYPSEQTEWSLEDEIIDAKNAGFTGVATGPKPGLAELAQKHGMIVLGYIASGQAS